MLLDHGPSGCTLRGLLRNTSLNVALTSQTNLKLLTMGLIYTQANMAISGMERKRSGYGIYSRFFLILMLGHHDITLTIITSSITVSR